MDVLKLEFNDKEDTILYLKDTNIDQVRIIRNDHERSTGTDIHYISININNSDDSYVLIYEIKQDRDIDYEYAIKQFDILMNVNREEF